MFKLLSSFACAIACVSILLYPLQASAADDEWSFSPTSLSTTVPTLADRVPIFYHFDDATSDSDWMPLKSGATYTICLDPDTTAATAGATVKINRAIDAESANGSHVLLGMTLTGTWPADCIEGVPGGTSIQVEIVSNAGTDTAVVSVRRE